MGNANSTEALASQLRSVVPEANGNGISLFKGQEKPFTGDTDREQFIHAVITVITQNGSLDLREYTFRLLYSRRDNNRMVARIVGEKDGVIRAKIEPEADGKDQVEGFRALKRDVETKLERILSALPGEGLGLQKTTTGESRPKSRSKPAVEARVTPRGRGGETDASIDEPPAYTAAIGEKRR